MSAWVHLETKACEHCGSDGKEVAELNVTYNLSPMLTAAGMTPRWIDLDGMSATWVGSALLGVIAVMETDPDKFRAMNPENGWGSFDRNILLDVKPFAEKCVAAGPQAVIRVSG